MLGGRENTNYHALIVLDEPVCWDIDFHKVQLRDNFDFGNDVVAYHVCIDMKLDAHYRDDFWKDSYDRIMHVEPATRFGDKALLPPPGQLSPTAAPNERRTKSMIDS